MDKILNAFIIALLIYSTKCTDTSVCVQKNSCLCEFSQYSKIDISHATQLLKPDDFLKDQYNKIEYYFHGCTDGVYTQHLSINGTNSTKTFRGSLITVYNETVNVLGNSSGIKFTPSNDGGTYSFVYRDTYGNVSANVILLCDNINHPFIKVLPNNTNEQLLILSSPHACIITYHPGLSTGSVLVILFFITAGIYFIGGAAILYFIRGARGLELIPNVDFWRQLPGLVKDGLIFLFSGCSANAISSTAETYDRI